MTRQWELLDAMVKDNKCWGLGWFIRNDGRIDVSLNIEGPWEFILSHKKELGGRTARRRDTEKIILKIGDEELDLVLVLLEEILKKDDRYRRLPWVYKAQDTRGKINEGNTD